MKSLLTFNALDMFCGAGGSSTGLLLAAQRLGLEARLSAINHWEEAITIHEANHPDARSRHGCAYRTTPNELVEGQLDLLMASPTCTFFSGARGGKPVSWDQRWGRMTPTQVYRWAKELKPRCLLVENVPEFQKWGPVCQRTTSCKEHGWGGPKAGGPERQICGKRIKAKEGIYFRRWIARLKSLGYRVEWRVLNAADFGDATTRRRFYLLGRRDGEDIVWPEPTHSETGSEGDLFTPATQRWRAAAEIIDWSLRGTSIFTRKKPLSKKTIVRIYAGAVRFNWPEPFLERLRAYMKERRIRIPELPTPRAARAQAIVFQVNQGADRLRNIRGASDEPLQTVVTRESLGLATPLVLPQNGSNGPRGVSEPAPTITTTSRGIGFVEPLVVPLRHSGVPSGVARCRTTDEPLPTIVAGANHLYLAEPFLLSQGAGGAPRSVEEPTPTIPARGAHAFLVPYYGATKGGAPVDEPLPTVTTRDRFGFVTPVTHDDASKRQRGLEEPLPTVTGAARGELAFVLGSFGERKGQTPRVRGVDKPAPTVCAKGYTPLVEPSAPPEVDILFRMLQPHELAGAMGFPPGYRFPERKTDAIRMIGNAVCVHVAAALVEALMRRRVAA